ncbi:MKI67 FHA domain-interacting nucleolar phosphoprotein-like [Anopheles darlingi]|uniref:MKI67 FHA domain-interacting nucleolar phosphoprotein-like n=1 Tax=Anopheles darlingi TaxID=43151 RepID=UPI0021003220|nr:MKI67 FHA domain-interacting nucleolar phosphoprotein-like [Anopheles darlingi]
MGKIKKAPMKSPLSSADPPIEKAPTEERGVVMVKNLPVGFYERELRQLFSQFGDVLRVYVARSKRTLRCKGFAYVEFLLHDVAEIAASALNNYMMFGQVLKTVVLPRRQHVMLSTSLQAFDDQGRQTTKYMLWLKRQAALENGVAPESALRARNARMLAKLEQTSSNLLDSTSELIKHYEETAELLKKNPVLAANRKRPSKPKAKEVNTTPKDKKAETHQEDEDDEDDDESFTALKPDDWDVPAPVVTPCNPEQKKASIEAAKRAKKNLKPHQEPVEKLKKVEKVIKKNPAKNVKAAIKRGKNKKA